MEIVTCVIGVQHEKRLRRIRTSLVSRPSALAIGLELQVLTSRRWWNRPAVDWRFVAVWWNAGRMWGRQL